MRNSNRYKDIFSSKEQLSRSDIEKYGEQGTRVDKNSIEQKVMSDPFEQDALEGWEHASYDTSVINSMRDKLFSNSSFAWMTVIGSLIIGGILVIGYQAFVADKNTQVSETTAIEKEEAPKFSNEIIIESSDVQIPEIIEGMRKAEKEEQIIPEEIIEDFIHMVEFEIEFPALPPIAIPESGTSPSAPVIDKINAKEIYLNDLKLIDYRAYRENPAVETKQLILTGTTADKEGKHSESFESNWQNVQIPYMQYLDKSVYYFNKGKSKKALARFETIIETYPLDVNANFYAGLCLFNFGEYTDAIAKFETCLGSTYRNFDDEAIWMKALSLEHLHREIEAKKLFTLISENNGFYAEQAREKLKK